MIIYIVYFNRQKITLNLSKRKRFPKFFQKNLETLNI
ncbi:hypothetical protein LRU_00396 [Ligilactobacillus ruminis SPM0211]|uniref:Uncharacterized protein n=1 Tax=Ligilactobacillus ruminis SPM0211 TaxID=1040964 RepID=F7QYA9_9LACO|nr:hypothetical protein LRU_00396 [Ligilactobacillus ruminis SPM0211]